MESKQFGCEELNPAELQQVNGGGLTDGLLRPLKSQLKYLLSTYNKMTGGLVNKILDKLIPVPPEF